MKRLLAPLVALLAALSIAACASYDKAQTENTILNDLSKKVEALTGTTIKSASCPDEIDLDKGAKFECTATLKTGREVKVDGVVANNSGDYRVDIAPEEIRGAVGSG